MNFEDISRDEYRQEVCSYFEQCRPRRREDYNMSLRSFLQWGSIALSAVLPGAMLASSTGAPAARLPVSTITVNVLSVDRESVHRDESRNPAQPDVVIDTGNFLARSVITKVLNTEHGLSPGAIIDIRYDVAERHPPNPSFPVRARLNAGETVTLTVFGRGSSFYWRR
jgi:hypothetical protein